ncbi:MAG: redoxin domain-containing protein [Candidatus Sulfotelmatobacter sp.]
MRRKLPNMLAAVLSTGMMVVTAAGPVVAQSAKLTEGAMPKVGDVAPDFKLDYFDGNDLKDVNLSQYRGKKNVILAFYIFAFTGG